MQAIGEVVTPEIFAELDRLCLDKLKPVSFGLQNSADRILKGITFRMAHNQPLSWRQRTAMYQICYRYRRQIGDTKFIARVLIAKAEADPLAEEEYRNAGRSHIRAWAASNPFQGELV